LYDHRQYQREYGAGSRLRSSSGIEREEHGQQYGVQRNPAVVNYGHDQQRRALPCWQKPQKRPRQPPKKPAPAIPSSASHGQGSSRKGCKRLNLVSKISEKRIGNADANAWSEFASMGESAFNCVSFTRNPVSVP
jgi:hypothetical protein